VYVLLAFCVFGSEASLGVLVAWQVPQDKLRALMYRVNAGYVVFKHGIVPELTHVGTGVAVGE